MDVKLTLKQERFIAEYLVDLNATQAAARAGYSLKTAGKIGQENLIKPAIAQAIAIAQQKTLSNIQLTKDDVVGKLTQVIDTFLLDGRLTGNSLKAIEILNKMVGWNATDKVDITSGGQPIQFNYVKPNKPNKLND